MQCLNSSIWKVLQLESSKSNNNRNKAKLFW